MRFTDSTKYSPQDIETRLRIKNDSLTKSTTMAPSKNDAEGKDEDDAEGKEEDNTEGKEDDCILPDVDVFLGLGGSCNEINQLPAPDI